MSEPKGIIGDPSTWPARTSGGKKLVLVQIGPNSYVKLTEEEARRRGLLPPEEKAQPQAQNKARRGRPKTKAEPETESE